MKTTPIGLRAVAMLTIGLSGCASSGVADVRDRLVGMSNGDLTTCLGQPAETISTDIAQTWTYNAPQMSGGTCTISATLKSGTLIALDYASSGSTQMDGECAWILQKCVQYAPAASR
jgi:hypothetical protein